MPHSSILALLTDFGAKDTYVGTMKGVILGIAPHCTLVDLTHEVAPQNIAEAALQLAAAFSYFPISTVFCCVVDPGVGSSRRAIAVRTERCYFVAPDNGLLTAALRLEPAVECVALDNPMWHLPRVSATFHGRDIFAPVAAHIVAGVQLAELGSRLAPDDLVVLTDIDPVQTGDGLRGKVVMADHFGNLITNIAGHGLDAVTQVRIGNIILRGMSRTYADVPPGAPVAYIGSSGYLEIGINKGNAARDLGVEIGAEVLVSAAC